MGTFTLPTSTLRGGDTLRGEPDVEEPPDEPGPEPTPTPTGSGSGGWFTLLDIAHEIRQEAAYQAVRPLIDCPVCGTPLDMNARGEVRCRFDGWSPA